jgi:hypothetical protein
MDKKPIRKMINDKLKEIADVLPQKYAYKLSDYQNAGYYIWKENPNCFYYHIEGLNKQKLNKWCSQSFGYHNWIDTILWDDDLQSIKEIIPDASGRPKENIVSYWIFTNEEDLMLFLIRFNLSGY